MTAPRVDSQELAAGRDRGQELAAGRDRGHELAAERDRLTERFVLMQSELGGLFYEMAIRDHLQLDLLVERAAAMQQVEAELRRVEQLLSPEDKQSASTTPANQL